MKINLSTEHENIIQLILLVTVGLLCEAFIFAIITTLYIPEVGWGVHHYSKIELLYRQFFFKYLDPNISTVSLIVSTACLVFFKLFLFPKIVISIENAIAKTKISEIIKNIHTNKNYTLYIFVFFSLLSFSFLDFYADIYNLNKIITYFFVIPLHYIALYVYWLYKDLKILNNIKRINNKNIRFVLIRYVIMTNPFFIMLTLISMLNVQFKIFSILEPIILLIVILFVLILVIYYLFTFIKLIKNSIIFTFNYLTKNNKKK